MIASVILGENIDTSKWIKELKEQKIENIFVVDYEYTGSSFMAEEIIYCSPPSAIKILNSFDSVNYYKSLYIYPKIR